MSSRAACQVDGCMLLTMSVNLLYVASMNEHHEYFPHMVCFDSQGMLVSLPECSTILPLHKTYQFLIPNL